MFVFMGIGMAVMIVVVLCFIYAWRQGSCRRSTRTEPQSAIDRDPSLPAYALEHIRRNKLNEEGHQRRIERQRQQQQIDRGFGQASAQIYETELQTANQTAFGSSSIANDPYWNPSIRDSGFGGQSNQFQQAGPTVF